MSESTGSGNELPEITPLELKTRLDQSQPLAILDVREAHERDIADLPYAGQLRIPVGELLARLEELDPEVNTVVYCRSGGRSGWAVRQLSAHGFEKVHNLRGGIMGWRDDVDPSLREY